VGTSALAPDQAEDRVGEQAEIRIGVRHSFARLTKLRDIG
jgi:hypothetical protein